MKVFVGSFAVEARTKEKLNASLYKVKNKPNFRSFSLLFLYL